MLGIDYHRAASQELFDASDYYSKTQDGLGQRFLHEVQLAMEEIAKSPQRHPAYFGDIRRCVLLRFPYAILYRVLPTEIRIISISHSSRHPGYWKSRR